MKTQQFPNLPKAFLYMRIHDQLQLVSDRSLVGMAIRLALYEKRPLSQILALIKDTYQDNPNATTEIVGEDTMKLILAL